MNIDVISILVSNPFCYQKNKMVIFPYQELTLTICGYDNWSLKTAPLHHFFSLSFWNIIFPYTYIFIKSFYTYLQMITRQVFLYFFTVGVPIRSLGQEDPLEKKRATHSRILAWKIPWTVEPGGLASKGLQRAEHNWVPPPSGIYITYLCQFHHSPISSLEK